MGKAQATHSGLPDLQGYRMGLRESPRSVVAGRMRLRSRAPCVCNTHRDFIAGEMPDNPPDVTGIMKSVIRVRGKKVN